MVDVILHRVGGGQNKCLQHLLPRVHSVTQQSFTLNWTSWLPSCLIHGTPATLPCAPGRLLFLCLVSYYSSGLRYSAHAIHILVPCCNCLKSIFMGGLGWLACDQPRNLCCSFGQKVKSHRNTLLILLSFQG